MGRAQVPFGLIVPWSVVAIDLIHAQVSPGADENVAGAVGSPRAGAQITPVPRPDRRFQIAARWPGSLTERWLLPVPGSHNHGHARWFRVPLRSRARGPARGG